MDWMGLVAREVAVLERESDTLHSWSEEIARMWRFTRSNGIHLVGRQGGKPALLAVDAFGPTWSHDGRWAYFTSERTGRAEVWKAPASGGPAVQVTMNGGMAPSESLDSQFLYFSRA